MNNLEKNSEGEKILKEAEKQEKEAQFMLAAFSYREALSMFRGSGNSEKQKICKKKMVEMNERMQVEFKQIEVEFGIPEEQAKKERQELIDLIDGNLQEVLSKIGRCATFNPKTKFIAETAQTNMPIMLSLVDSVTVDTKGNIVKGSHDAVFAWKMKIYSFAQGLISHIYLKTIFESMLFSGKLNLDDLIAEFEKREVIPKDDLEIIKQGLERFFSQDYISAIHILVPKFESVFLRLSELMGIDVISLNAEKNISTQKRTLSEVHLDSEAFKKVWGEDLCEQLNYVLFRSLGSHLRHKVAHGEIDPEECNFDNIVLVIYFYIAVLYRIKKIEKK